MNKNYRAWYNPKYDPSPIRFDLHNVRGICEFVNLEIKSFFIMGAVFADEDWVIEQSSGLKDKFGVEIFDGDIVRAEIGAIQHLCIVRNGFYEYDPSYEYFGTDKYIGFYTKAYAGKPREQKLGKMKVFDDYNIKPIHEYETLEVLGNIHQTKYLLEEGRI